MDVIKEAKEKMRQDKNEIIIPREFKKYFWDVDFDELNFQKHRNYILERMLNFGAFDSFNWIFKTFNNNEVENLLDKKGKYSLSRNSFLFWGKLVKDEELWKRS